MIWAFRKKRPGAKPFSIITRFIVLSPISNTIKLLSLKVQILMTEAMNGLLEDGDLYYAADSEAAILWLSERY